MSLQSIPTRILTVEKASMFCTGFGSRMKLMDIPDMYRVGKSTVGCVVRQFVKAFLKHMDRFICCPAKEVASQQVKQGFEAQRGFLNFVGAIDNTHIELELPQIEWHTAWRDRNARYSMSLQGVVESNMRFLDILTGWPSSVNDLRLL